MGFSPGSNLAYQQQLQQAYGGATGSTYPGQLGFAPISNTLTAPNGANVQTVPDTPNNKLLLLEDLT